jgi:hypothetical protein
LFARSSPAASARVSADDQVALYQVALYLDTFGDGQRAYVFASNPLGIQRDAAQAEGRGEDSSFDTLFTTDGRLTEFGYVVRMAVPFKSLRFGASENQQWGVALGRTFVHNGYKSFWPHLTLKRETFTGQFARLLGLEKISPGVTFQFVPFGTFTRARLLDYGAPGYVNRREERAGLDGKVVIKNAFTLDMTANPDFSQVESDDPQLTINRRFELFYPEKRPFFQENANFFETPINLFFSRRIVDPDYGARLTGKAGGWIVVLLSANDRSAERRLAPGLTVSHGEDYQLYLNHKLRNGRSDASFYINVLKWLDIYGYFAHGRDVIFTPAAGLLPFVADGRNGTFTLTIRPGAKLWWQDVYNYNRLALHRAAWRQFPVPAPASRSSTAISCGPS